MMNIHVQCPKCGGHDVHHLDPGRDFRDAALGDMGLPLAVVVGVVLFFVSGTRAGDSAPAFFFGAVGFFGVLILFRAARQREPSKYLLECNLCKHIWDERTIDGSKPVTPNLESIEEGQKELARRRRIHESMGRAHDRHE